MMDAAAAIARLGAADSLLVGVDFDGVLAELVGRPEDARPVPGVPEVLQALVASPGVRVAAVSGRRRADLAARLDPPSGVILIGEHGADPGIEELDIPDGYHDVRLALEAVAEGFDGAWVEEKRTGLTIHGRALSEADAADLTRRAEIALESLVPGRYERGNRIVDVRLTGVTKGAAVSALRSDDEVVLYVGDDTTDESVFEVLVAGDVGVKVGPGSTAADCRLPNPAAVVGFLTELVGTRAR